MEDSGETRIKRKRKIGFWKWAVVSLAVRLVLCCFSKTLNLSSRPEVSTPITSLRRLAEGYWLKKLSMSPYSGSMYHGSPLMISVLGPLTVERTGVLSGPLLYSLVSLIADLFASLLIRATGHRLEAEHARNLKFLGLNKFFEDLEILPAGDIAALVYLWNPFTIVSCVGGNTSPMENLFVVMSLYGASAGIISLAALGWVIASHLSLYPVVLVIPIIFILGFGVDKPPRKLFQHNSLRVREERPTDHVQSLPNKYTTNLRWQRVVLFLLWALFWASYVLVLCAVSMKDYGGLREMFKRTYGFILTIPDLSPNIGVLWYFFAEVFDFFRNFFLMVFHANILFMILPLAIRLNHRPLFLAFVYLAISSMLKSYPSVGDSALYLSLLALFINDLAEMKFSFFLFCGYVGISLLSPVMHNLWIWRGTGNANFYFATAMAYACFQIVLVVESVSAMLNYDRKIRKLCDKITKA